MSPQEIKHFLVIYDLADRQVKVEEFGTDYDAALAAYGELEQDIADGQRLDAVLLGAESLAVIKKTHSSYFESAENAFERLIFAVR